MIKTEFMKLYEELNDINDNKSTEPVKEDATEVAASKRFWAAAKNKQIDKEAFHTAFDAELTELGLMNLFDEYGRLTRRDSYGAIKSAKDANPDNWAVRALLKLWSLAFSDGVDFPMSADEMAAEKEARRLKDEESARLRAEEAEARRKQLEAEQAQIIKDFKDTLPAALKAMDKDIHDEYMTYFNLTDTDIDVEIGFHKSGMYEGRAEYIKILPNNSKAAWSLDGSALRRRTDPERLASFLNSDFARCLAKVKEETRKAELLRKHKINADAIDILKYHPNTTVVLLGESGTTYFLDADSARSARMGETAIGSVEEITEPYKVIYTKYGYADSSNNNRTTSDSHYYYYHSWDSSEEAKLTEYLPEIGHSPNGWGYSDVKKTDGTDDYYSRMNNIDSWAYEQYTSLATD